MDNKWTDQDYREEAFIVYRSADRESNLKRFVYQWVNDFYTDVPPELSPSSRRLYRAVKAVSLGL
jgi:hypothetical protein